MIIWKHVEKYAQMCYYAFNSLQVRNYGRKKHRQHQIVVSGLNAKGLASSSLFVYSDCLEVINLWFAALRIVLKVSNMRADFNFICSFISIYFNFTYLLFFSFPRNAGRAPPHERAQGAHGRHEHRSGGE
jgi:hypothetical protein